MLEGHLTFETAIHVALMILDMKIYLGPLRIGLHHLRKSGGAIATMLFAANMSLSEYNL
jgi:hypothetical protein